MKVKNLMKLKFYKRENLYVLANVISQLSGMIVFFGSLWWRDVSRI